MLGNLLTGKEIVRAGFGAKRVGYILKKNFLIAPYPITNFEIQKHYENEPRFDGVFSRDNLSKTKDGAYVISLDEYADVGTHWIALFCKKTENVYFDSFGVEHAPEEIKEFIENKNIKATIFRVQSDNSIMCGHFCIGFIDFIKNVDWFYKFVFSLWFWKKWQYNFELFQRWMNAILLKQIIEQTWLIKQDLD